MKKQLTLGIAFAALIVTAQAGTLLQSSMTPMVGGQAMYANKDIVSNAVNSKDHTTLVAAVKAAGLVSTLQSKGPFTVFAPTNGAFALLPAGTVDTLVQPENKEMLTKILTYHVVSGTYDAARIMSLIKKGNGEATLKTVQGGNLRARMNGPRNVVLVDAAGNYASISTYDVRQSNGIIHVVDKVLMPSK